jgi:hypothetical protein
MAADMSRDDVTALLTQVTQVLTLHKAGELDTESARNDIEQLIATAAGQCGDRDRRAIASYADYILSAHRSEQFDIEQACRDIEAVIEAAVNNNPQFDHLIQLRADK